MTLHAAIEPTQDLELYLGYSRPAGSYAAFADIRHSLMSAVPTFDFDRIMTNPDVQVLTVRDEDSRVRGLAVLGRGARPVFHLYYADSASATRSLMTHLDDVISHGQSAPHP